MLAAPARLLLPGSIIIPSSFVALATPYPSATSPPINSTNYSNRSSQLFYPRWATAPTPPAFSLSFALSTADLTSATFVYNKVSDNSPSSSDIYAHPVNFTTSSKLLSPGSNSAPALAIPYSCTQRRQSLIWKATGLLVFDNFSPQLTVPWN